MRRVLAAQTGVAQPGVDLRAGRAGLLAAHGQACTDPGAAARPRVVLRVVPRPLMACVVTGWTVVPAGVRLLLADVARTVAS